MSGVLMRSFSILNESYFGVSNLLHTSAKAYAARKGTREKARKKKVKVEVKKIGFIPHNLRNLEKLKALRGSLRSVDIKSEEPIDKVFPTKYYKVITYPIMDAVRFHREANHPTILNSIKAPVTVTIELNMVAEKKTRFIDSFSRIVDLPHPFGTYDDRTVLALAKDPENVAEVTAAGADLAGGLELVQKIQNGSLVLQDFKYVICHPSILPELVPIRGLLKRKFPTPKSGTLGPDLVGMLSKFKKGLQYRCVKDDDEHDLGIVKAQIGDLEMDEKHLEQNFMALVQDIESARPRRGGDFITWVWCQSDPSPEKFKVEYKSYIENVSTS